ncbi:hypothetical protein GPALN_012718 [Globodera pallida]|nr:hypothetical protein GPALN_012718 [Globodera pallida]
MLLNFFLTVVPFVLSIASAYASECAADWTYLASGRKCIKVFPAPTDWSSGEMVCVYQGGHHISVKDLRENYALAEMAKTMYGKQVWLGAFRSGTPYYSWSDLTPFGYFSHWRGNVPPPRSGLGCVKLDGITGDWVQSCCRKRAGTICQKAAGAGGLRRQ